MIHIECSWCDADVILAELDAPSVECAGCGIRVEFSAEPEPLACAA